MRPRRPSKKVTRALIVCAALTCQSPLIRGQAAPTATLFVVHGTPRDCSSITQLDSALSDNYQAFFAGWNEKDYQDAIIWSDACADFGWHVPGHPRPQSLQAQHDRVFGPAQKQPSTSGSSTAQQPSRSPRDGALPAEPPSRAPLKLPADGSPVVGRDMIVSAHYQDTLFDIARRNGLGYEEIISANPSVDIWLPGEGTRILLPMRRILPPGSREGIVVNLPEHRLYYFPKPGNHEAPVVMTFPVSIGRDGEGTPLGQTHITEKTAHPAWIPTQSIRNEHAERGDPLPREIAPGPDNPIGNFKMRLGFGDGTYEIHGTNKPASVGMAATHGCLGMYPEDLAALYALISVGTPVRLINVPVKLAWSAGTLLLEAHRAVDTPNQGSQPNLEQLARVLRATSEDAGVSIVWERARNALDRADGVTATIGSRVQ
jgi:L,D-transpeptidase ErfK/SrfK